MDEHPTPPPPTNSPCCACGLADGGVHLVTLARRAPTPGKGWGCHTCNLAPNGALALVCPTCWEAGADPQFALIGWPGEGGRLPLRELDALPFDHDPRRHGGTLADLISDRPLIVMRDLVTGGDPAGMAPVPDINAFNDAGRQLDFIEAPEVEAVADGLIGRYLADFEILRTYTLRYLWADEGGERHGKSNYGWVKVLRGEARHAAQTDALIVVAADHLRNRRWTAWQLEALVCDLLRGLEVSSTGALVSRPPDFVGRYFTLRQYGAWQGDLSAAGQIYRQLSLPIGEAARG